jgi:hypothetical protein
MGLHPAEEATIRAFVLPTKQERLLGQLVNPKRRKHALDAFDHFRGWDPRCAHPLPSSSAVVGSLRAAGAPNECHVISDDPALDGRDLRWKMPSRRQKRTLSHPSCAAFLGSSHASLTRSQRPAFG